MVDLKDIKGVIAESKALEVADLNNLFVLIHAEKGIGKSTLTSRFSRPFILDAEFRLDNIIKPDGERPAQQGVTSWKQIEDWTNAFVDTTPAETDIDTFCVDGLATAFKLLAADIMSGLKAETLNDEELGYAKGWIKAANLFNTWFMKLLKMKQNGYGIVLTTQDRIVPFSSGGHEFDKRVPAIANDKEEKYGWSEVKAFPDLVIYGYKQQTQKGVVHMARLKGNEMIEACCPTPPKGHDMPEVIPFTFNALERAWNGE